MGQTGFIAAPWCRAWGPWLMWGADGAVLRLGLSMLAQGRGFPVHYEQAGAGQEAGRGDFG